MRLDLAPGQIIGNDYRVVQPLAAGGMGAVYVAEQLSTGKRRALKVMHRELASDAESQRRFLQEARVGSLIASEHIVEVQTAGIDPATGHPFLVMELLEGEDLQARLARGPLSLDEARGIIAQLAHALAAAHDAHVVHRDLKPQNVFLSVRRSTGDTLHVKVLDFGISKIVEDHKATAAMGTPMWLAPEQTERGHITSAADVWAFGLVVFTMLTGATFWKTPARKDGTLIDLLGEILRDPIPPASARAAELGRSVPPGFDAWLSRCLSRSPSHRFPNAREAHAALVPVLAAPAPRQPTAVFTPAAQPPMPPVMMGAATTMPGPPHPPIAPPPSRLDLGLVLGIGVALVLLVGAGAAIVIYARSTLPPAVSRPVASAPPMTAPSASIGAPPAQPIRADEDVNVMVISDDPQLQTAIVSDATLTPKITHCIAPVRAAKGASIVLAFEVSSAGAKPVMTQAQPMGPHVQCVSNAITRRPLTPSKKRATLQVVVSWT